MTHRNLISSNYNTLYKNKLFFKSTKIYLRENYNKIVLIIVSMSKKP